MDILRIFDLFLAHPLKSECYNWPSWTGKLGIISVSRAGKIDERMETAAGVEEIMRRDLLGGLKLS